MRLDTYIHLDKLEMGADLRHGHRNTLTPGTAIWQLGLQKAQVCSVPIIILAGSRTKIPSPKDQLNVIY